MIKKDLETDIIASPCCLKLDENDASIPCLDETLCFQDIYDQVELEPTTWEKDCASFVAVLPKPFELLQASCEQTVCQIESLHSVIDVQQICQLLETHVSLLIHNHENGIGQTECIVKSTNPLFDGIKIELKTYDTAQGQYQIYIESVQAFETFVDVNHQQIVPKLLMQLGKIHVNRLEINGRSILEKKEKEQGRLFKKVAKTK